MFDWAEILQQYGYWAVMIGTFFEGETVVVLGAYAVQQHILNYWLLIFAAMIGGFIGDQFYYFIGSKFGYEFIQKRPKLAEKFDRASYLIARYPILMILIMRFAWGLRTLIPMSFGVKKYPLRKYTPLNLLASFIWAWIVVTLGIQLSQWFEQIWQTIFPQYHDVLISVVVVICLILVVWCFHIFYRKKRLHPSNKD